MSDGVGQTPIPHVFLQADMHPATRNNTRVLIWLWVCNRDTLVDHREGIKLLREVGLGQGPARMTFPDTPWDWDCRFGLPRNGRSGWLIWGPCMQLCHANPMECWG